MIAAKDIIELDGIFNEVIVIWDRENVHPCCPEFPSRLVDYFHTLGNPTKLIAVARWNILATRKYQEEIRNAGFSMVHNPYSGENSSDAIILEELIRSLENANYSQIVLISGDSYFFDYLQSLDTPMVLVSNPEITSKMYKQSGIDLVPYFDLCNCDAAVKMRRRWALSDYDRGLTRTFERIFDKFVGIRLAQMGSKVREIMRGRIGELDWKYSQFGKMKDVADYLGIEIT